MLIFSLSVLMTASSGQPMAVLGRAKQYHIISSIDVLMHLLGNALAITLAMKGFGAWALVLRAVLQTAIRFLLALYFSRTPYRLMSLANLKTYIQDVKFGGQIMISRIVNGFVHGMDKAIVGKITNLSDFGGYSRAQQLSMLLDTTIRNSITSPSLAYIGREEERDKNDMYLDLLWIVLIAAGIPSMLLAVHGDLLMPLILGSQWIEYGWMLQWMGVYALRRMILGTISIINIDRKFVKRTVQYNLVSAVIILIAIGVLLLSSSIAYFIISLSLATLIFWLLATLHILIEGNRLLARHYVFELGKMASLMLISIAGGLYAKQMLGQLPVFVGQMEFIFTLTSVLVQGFFTLIILAIMDLGRIQKILKMFR